MSIHITDINVSKDRLSELPEKYDWGICVFYGTGDRQKVQVMFNDWTYDVQTGIELHDIVSCLVGLAKYEWY